MKIVVFLDEIEGTALAQLARQEVRDPRAQAYLIIRDELARRGLLSDLPEKQSMNLDTQKGVPNA